MQGGALDPRRIGENWILCRVIHPIAEPLNVQAAADGQFLHPRDRAAVGAEQNHRAKMG